MKLKLSVNFSFGNLSRRLNKITKEYVEDFAKSSEVISKKTIDSGKLKSIKQSTKRWRKSEGYPTNPPLKASGTLYNSIKASGNKLEIIQYGKWHNDGEVPTTSARPFISGLSISLLNFFLLPLKIVLTIRYLRSLAKCFLVHNIINLPVTF